MIRVMGDVDSDLQKLLAGEIVEINPDIKTSDDKDNGYVPIVKRTVCYIVMAFVFDDQGRILLIQEAKSSCHGLWYLPAGRLEPGENIIDGVKREVLEEAGIEIEPLTLCDIETYGILDWFRLNYIGKMTGGKLKTLAEKDKESLQAQWFPVSEVLNGYVKLRHQDFFKSLKLAQAYIAKDESCRHPYYQIGVLKHKHLLLRPVILKKNPSGTVEVLCQQKPDKPPTLPCLQLNHREPNFSYSLNYLFKDAFNKSKLATKLELRSEGLLTLEHCGIPAREHDGICFTPLWILPERKHKKFKTVTNTDYVWHTISNSGVLDELTRRVFTNNLLIQLNM